MSAAENDMMTFDFFPELLPKNDSPAPDNIQFESEEEALDAILQQKESADSNADEWPPPDPGDIPGAVPPPPPDAVSSEAPQESELKPLTQRMLRRIALGFLAAKRPNVLAAGVRCIVPKITLDATAFNISPTLGPKAGPRQTILVLAAGDPDCCLMPASLRKRYESDLAAELTKKEELETIIRNTEPELNASLFADAAQWEYEKSKSVKYQRCLRKIEKLNHDLRFTGKLDRILAEHVANENYLLVPDDVELSDSVPLEWGILLAHRDLTVTVGRPAAQCESAPELQCVFALYTAQAASEDVPFANGIMIRSGGRAEYSPLPRRRRPFIF